MKNISKVILILMTILSLYGCKDDKSKPLNKNYFDGWEMICLDLNDTGKGYLISFNNDTLSSVDYVWEKVRLIDSTEAMVRRPKTRLKTNITGVLKRKIVSETINLFKEPRPFDSFNTRIYSANNSYVLVIINNSVLQYHFHYNDSDGTVSNSELVELIQLFKQGARTDNL